ncbi:hypothetical protein [Streptomyces sp. NRRL S-1824]|uniref:hypothetical protein n=1 Tax=Streptomyces sp. NRRL S-1824 TaxID=1463889 RepID=UPI000A665DA2|nr:hypothetical protein [Streptomyces sp. NRRL S-1824]
MPAAARSSSHSKGGVLRHRVGVRRPVRVIDRLPGPRRHGAAIAQRLMRES